MTFTRDPNFGRDPWIGPGLPLHPDEWEAAHAALLARGAVVYLGEDAIGGDIQLLSAGLNGYGSYVDNFGGFTELIIRFGQEFVYQGVPGGYTSASNMQELINVAGNRDFIRFAAHYGFGPHLCGPSTCGYPQAHITQWDDKGPNGENVDRWIISSLFGNKSPFLWSFTIFGNKAICADMEPGAMQIGDFPHWYDNVAIHTPVPSPPHPHPPTEDILAVALCTDLDGQVHLVQETKDGKVHHRRQMGSDGAWMSNSVVLLDNGAVPAPPAKAVEEVAPPAPPAEDAPAETIAPSEPYDQGQDQ